MSKVKFCFDFQDKSSVISKRVAVDLSVPCRNPLPIDCSTLIRDWTTSYVMKITNIVGQ